MRVKCTKIARQCTKQRQDTNKPSTSTGYHREQVSAKLMMTSEAVCGDKCGLSNKPSTSIGSCGELIYLWGGCMRL